MAQNSEIHLLVDAEGRILAAQLGIRGRAARSKDKPTVTLVPRPGERVLKAQVPTTVLKLPGPHLHRLFSEVQVSPDSRVILPKFKVSKSHDK